MSLKLLILLQLCNVLFVTCIVPKSCPPGTIASGTNAELCYKFVKTPDTFVNAEGGCKTEGGHLVQLGDKKTNLLVTDLARKNIAPDAIFWSGGENVQVEVLKNFVWIWTDNSFVKYFNWINPTDAVHGDKNCMTIKAVDASWASENCAASLPYVCQIPIKTPVCDSGWAFFEQNYKCYKMFSVPSGIMHGDAEIRCVAFGGHLSSIHNEAENSIIVELTTTGTHGNWKDVGVWTGGVSDGNNKWSWTDGSPFDFTNWSPIDPDRKSEKAPIALYPDDKSTWDDVGATSTVKRYVCQKDAVFP